MRRTALLELQGLPGKHLRSFTKPPRLCSDTEHKYAEVKYNTLGYVVFDNMARSVSCTRLQDKRVHSGG